MTRTEAIETIELNFSYVVPSLLFPDCAHCIKGWYGRWPPKLAEAIALLKGGQ